MRRSTWIVIALLGCQEYTVGKGASPPVDSAPAGPSAGVCGTSAGPRTNDPLEGCAPYDIGGFQPWVEWTGAKGRSSNATPIVADLDGDGLPEILVNVTPGFAGVLQDNELWVLHGDGSGVVWKKADAKLGNASPVAVGDIDNDGEPEIVGVRSKGRQSPLGRNTRYAVVAWDKDGNELWESADYGRLDFEYATGPILADLDGDGNVEIVAGRVILHADGTERGRGTLGRGSYGVNPGNATESTIPAVADLDLDGTQEVIVGNAMYGPDGELVWDGSNFEDGMVSVANLDDDPEGEFVATSFGMVRAHDTDGTKLWGPYRLECVVPACHDGDSGTAGDDFADILSNAAIGDIDNDGRAEIVVAGGSQVVALNHDGTILWEKTVQDVSGATGASIFDFEGDGVQEVVYIDEIKLYAFDGITGQTKFESNRHSSNTMMDYPTIADVDADGEAEIVVAHVGLGHAFTVYGQADGQWAPARKLWNQHAYSIDNINDDLTIPRTPTQAFTTHNSWHAATQESLRIVEDRFDLQVTIPEVCEAQCGFGLLHVAVQAVNRTDGLAAPSGIPISLYVLKGNRRTKVDTLVTTATTPATSSGDPIVFEIPADLVRDADAIRVVVDDDGSGGSVVPECEEDDNAFEVAGPWCLGGADSGM